MTKAYCEKHDEHEPDDHNEPWWTCPKCSKEALENIRKVDSSFLLDPGFSWQHICTHDKE
jgi:hypothetical protein